MPIIKNLTTLTPSDRLYIHLNTKAMRYRFMADAEREGITYTDGTSATDVTAEDIVCLFCDGTLAKPQLGWTCSLPVQKRTRQSMHRLRKIHHRQGRLYFLVSIHAAPQLFAQKRQQLGVFFYFSIFFTFSLSADKSPVFSMILSALFWRSSSLICDAILFLA